MTDEQVLLMMKRIKTAEPELMDYLESLSRENYKKWVNSNSSANDICKGYAICVDSLIMLIRNCDKEVATSDNSQAFF